MGDPEEYNFFLNIFSKFVFFENSRKFLYKEIVSLKGYVNMVAPTQKSKRLSITQNKLFNQ